MNTKVCFEGQNGSYNKNGKAKKTKLKENNYWLTNHHFSFFLAPNKTCRKKPKALDLPHPLKDLI
jgi:hypothetical protein